MSWRNNRGYLRLPAFERDIQLGGWKAGLSIAPCALSVGIWWDNDPINLVIFLPFMHLSIERDIESRGAGIDWGWMLFRLLVGKQEMRLDFDLNYWVIGLQLFGTDDFSLHFGPFNVQCEHNKLYSDNNFTMRVGGLRKVPSLRIRSPGRQPCSCVNNRCETP